MGQASLKEKQEQFFLSNIHDLVQSSPDPDLAEMILCDSHEGVYFQSYHESLRIPREKLDGTLNYLFDNELVFLKEGNFSNEEDKKKFAQIKTCEGIESYLKSPLAFGAWEVLDVKTNKNAALNAMKSIEDLCIFSYSKNFEFDDLTKLKELRSKSHLALEPIKKEEEKYWHEILGIPKQFFGIPSFVKKDDPTNIDGYDKKYFHLYANFSSLDEAFEVGFDKAHGYPLSKNPFKKHGEEVKNFPYAIEIEKRGEEYNFNLNNFILAVNNYRSNSDKGTFDYRKEAKYLLPVLKERLEVVLGKD